MDIFNRSEKKWLSVLIGERKLPKKEMCHLSWDKLKRKTCHLKRGGGSIIFHMYYVLFRILNLLEHILLMANATTSKLIRSDFALF